MIKNKITVRDIDPILWKKLKIHAAKTDQTIQSLVQMAIEKLLKEKEDKR